MVSQNVRDALRDVEQRIQTDAERKAFADMIQELGTGRYPTESFEGLSVDSIVALLTEELTQRVLFVTQGGKLAPQGLVEGEEFLAQPTADAPFADFGKRYLAWVIDWVLLSVFSVSVVAGVYYLLGQPTTQKEFLIACASPFLLIIYWLYYAFQESSKQQGTLGKRTMKIIVVDRDYQRLTFKKASVRFLGRLVSHLVPLFMGFFMMMLTEKKQTLHDKIAQTYVIKSPDPTAQIAIAQTVKPGGND